MFDNHDPYIKLLPLLCKLHKTEIKLANSELCKTCTDKKDNLRYLLNGLNDNLKGVRQQFRLNKIDFNYSLRDNRKVYMLAYFPHYIELIYYTLHNKLKDLFSKKKEINVFFLGGGPLPELLGFLNLIKKDLPEVNKVNFVHSDINTNWYDVEIKEITLKMIDNYYGKDIIPNHINLNLFQDFKKVPELISNADFVISQNCFNDCSDYETLCDNYYKIWDSMKSNSILAVII